MQAKYPVPGRLLVPATCAATYTKSGTCAVWYPEFRASIPGVPPDLLNKQCQSVVEFNPNHIAPNSGHAGGEGEDTDFYLYVTSQNVGCSGAVAWASFCLLDVATFQPRIGVVNFCPNQQQLLLQDPDLVIATITHEVIHALVRRNCPSLKIPMLAIVNSYAQACKQCAAEDCN